MGLNEILNFNSQIMSNQLINDNLSTNLIKISCVDITDYLYYVRKVESPEMVV